MLTYPNIDPVAISLGPLQVHWYGLMYLLAFLFAWGMNIPTDPLQLVSPP